jgi:hypothetical protein
MSHPATGATGDRTGARRGTPWWLWLLIALAVVALLLIGLTQCGGGNDPNAGSAGSGASAAPTGAAAPAPGSAPAPDAAGGSGAAGAGAGSISVDGAAVSSVAQVAGPGGELTPVVGKTVTARNVMVQSVPADEGFWLGPSETERVWVQLSGTGESGYVVRQGDRVELTGRVIANDPGFANRVGVDAAEGAEQLTRQAAHIEVAKSDLRKSAG